MASGPVPTPSEAGLLGEPQWGGGHQQRGSLEMAPPKGHSLEGQSSCSPAPRLCVPGSVGL